MESMWTLEQVAGVCIALFYLFAIPYHLISAICWKSCDQGMPSHQLHDKID